MILGFGELDLVIAATAAPEGRFRATTFEASLARSDLSRAATRRFEVA